MITYERSTLNEQRKVYWARRSSSNDLSSTRNIMPGTVDQVQEAAVNSEVILKLDGGTLLTAIITNASVRSLKLKAGDEAFAAFKASHVILAVE
jgi:molybdate transport system regulatory protein